MLEALLVAACIVVIGLLGLFVVARQKPRVAEAPAQQTAPTPERPVHAEPRVAPEAARGADAASRIAATREVLIATMELGAVAAEAIVRREHPEAVRLHPEPQVESDAADAAGPPQPIAERLWTQLFRDRDRYIVVETFAGHARLGWRSHGDALSEQGSLPYLTALLRDAGGEAHVDDVASALAEGRLRYLCVRVPIREVEGRSEIDDLVVADFDVETPAEGDETDDEAEEGA